MTYGDPSLRDVARARESARWLPRIYGHLNEWKITFPCSSKKGSSRSTRLPLSFWIVSHALTFSSRTFHIRPVIKSQEDTHALESENIDKMINVSSQYWRKRWTCIQFFSNKKIIQQKGNLRYFTGSVLVSFILHPGKLIVSESTIITTVTGIN
jgi:hypothetical protein